MNEFYIEQCTGGIYGVFSDLYKEGKLALFTGANQDCVDVLLNPNKTENFNKIINSNK